MCGIAGFAAAQPGSEDIARLGRALVRLEHRGPDDSGSLSFPAMPDRGPVVAMGNRRLSILDLSPAARQPMTTADGRYSLTYNGEIYNEGELRSELEALGCRFQTRCDSEVLLYAWATWGPAMLARLDGMFAFALLDRTERQLTLARDPFGIKPLFVSRPSGSALVFASEVAALRELRPMNAVANPRRLRDYLIEGFTSRGTETLFEGIEQVPAGHYLRVSLDRPGEGSPIAYWQPSAEPTRSVTLASAALELRELFTDTVRRYLRSDVPLGFSVSGGVDSSSVLNIARRVLGPDAPLRAYGYVADEPAISENIYQASASAACGAGRQPVHIRSAEVTRDLDALIDRQAEPFVSPTIYAQYRVFARAREDGVKVILGGQGSDEVFAGYQRFTGARVASLLSRGRVLQASRLAAAASERWGLSRRSIMRGALSWALPYPATRAYRRMRRAWRGSQEPEWFRGQWFAGAGVPAAIPWRPQGRDALREYLAHTVTSAHLQDLMRYEDRNAMSLSMENRVPFLSIRLTRFVSTLPEECLVSPAGELKCILREAMRGLVPDTILDRRVKIGFAVPVVRWLTEASSWVERKLAMASACPAVDAKALQRRWALVRQTGNLPSALDLWRCITLVTWAERFEVQWQ